MPAAAVVAAVLPLALGCIFAVPQHGNASEVVSTRAANHLISGIGEVGGHQVAHALTSDRDGVFTDGGQGWLITTEDRRIVDGIDLNLQRGGGA